MTEPDEIRGWRWKASIGAVLLATTMGFEGWMAVPERLNAWEIREGTPSVPGRPRTYEESTRRGAPVESAGEKRFVLALVAWIIAFLGTSMLVSGVRTANVKVAAALVLAGVVAALLGLWGSATAMAMIGLLIPFVMRHYERTRDGRR